MGISREDLEGGRIDLADAVDHEAEPVGPIHPGEILRDDFLAPLNVSAYRLAQDIGVPPNRITEILNGRRSISADTALRLARYFGTSARFWMNLQAHYDLEIAQRDTGNEIAERVHPLHAA